MEASSGHRRMRVCYRRRPSLGGKYEPLSWRKQFCRASRGRSFCVTIGCVPGSAKSVDKRAGEMGAKVFASSRFARGRSGVPALGMSVV
jgi:hypothetical protein